MKAIFLALLLPVTVSYAQTKKPAAKAHHTPVKKTAALSPTDSLSYAIGVQVADFYKMQGVESINADMVKKGFNDVYKNTPAVTPDQANMTIQQKLQEFMRIPTKFFIPFPKTSNLQFS